MTPGKQLNGRTATRAAIYTRKSTEEGLEQEFNSLDHQREACEAYIKSQDWECVATRYDDGGYSGGTLDRPALQRLLADVEAGLVDRIVFYKIDRFSRSLIDFVRLIERLEPHGVSIVSVTQSIDTGTSMGRLTINVLMSFAQFERELISERTREKIAATRRKGKWSGGTPPLGYDVAAGPKLVVNEEEARQVQAIFHLYLQLESLVAVVQEVEKRGWVGKLWTSRKGRQSGGLPYTKTSLHRLLTNATVAGLVAFKGQTYQGEHEAIVDLELWQRVQAQLRRNGRTGGTHARNKFGALLKGLLRCTACSSAMTPTHSTRGSRRYRYYACIGVQKRGRSACETRPIPAGEIEQFVVDQIKRISEDSALIDAIVVEARRQIDGRIDELEIEERRHQRILKQAHQETCSLALEMANGEVHPAATARLADLQERVLVTESKSSQARAELDALRGQLLERSEVVDAMARFDILWTAMTPQERVRVVRLLVERVDYDSRDGKVGITFLQTGIQALGAKPAAQEDAA